MVLDILNCISEFAACRIFTYASASFPNSQPGGPGYPFSSGSLPMTYLAWEALPVAKLPPA